jgi:transposase
MVIYDFKVNIAPCPYLFVCIKYPPMVDKQPIGGSNMETLALFDKPIEKSPIVINSDIKLIEHDNLRTLVVVNYPIFTYNTSDKDSERYLIAQLSRNRLTSQKILASCFDTHINTIKNYKSRFLSQGLQGIVSQKPSLDEPRKITPQVVRKVLAYYFKHSSASENEIAKQVSSQLAFSVSQPSVGRILERCGFKVKGEKPLTEPFKGIIDNRQLELTFSPFTTVTESVKPKEIPDNYTRADNLYIKRLKKGIFSPYGASLIYTPLISRFGLLESYLSIYGRRDNKYISSAQVWLTFFHMVSLGFPSIESLTNAHGEEFGSLIGRNYLPSVRSIRESLSDFGSRAKSEELIFHLCQRFIEHHLASLGVLYIDGHFLPYFGFEPTLKSWYSLRRFAIKGNIQYFANDREQNPLFFIIRPPTIDLIRAIYEMIPFMRKITDRPLTLIFDRGGFSQEFFINLRDHYPDITFITWADENSFSIGEKIRNIDEALFKLSLIHLKTKKVKVKLAELEIPIGEYGPMRAIIVLVPGSKKRIAILTNDLLRDKRGIAFLMINRWGQENFFKLMKKDYHIDYHPGYDTREIESAPLIKNPQYDRISKTIKKINTLITKASAELGGKTQQSKLKHQPLSRLEEKNQTLINKIYSLKVQKKRWLKKRTDTPRKISLKEAYLHQDLKELDLEKKAILDSVKITVYNLQRHLMQFINRSTISNGSSVNTYDIIKQITNRGAKLKLSYSTLYVTIGYFNDKQIQKIAEKLCEYLNALNPITLDKFAFNIRYRVEER